MSPPRQVGPFRIVKKLGTGAAASTYLAAERVALSSTTLLACLKVPHRAFVGDRQFIKAFICEGRFAAELRHPNIVQLVRVGDDPHGVPFLGYDFIEGMDLGELLAVARAARAQLEWPLVAYMALEVAQALEHAHEDHRDSRWTHPRPPVIHRDLAPPNILLGLSGRVCVTDFGLARAMDRAWILASGQRGRIAYAAPEYLLGQPYDARADLYSFGAVFFEALTGRRPFPAEHMHQRNTHLPMVLARDRPSVRSLRPELQGSAPPEDLVALAEILDQLLEPNPADRIPTAAALVDALGKIDLPPSVGRHLREVVKHHQPAERRSIRMTSGEHPAMDPWSAPDPLVQADGFDRERDGIRVSAEGAERLIAAFAHEANESIEDVIATFDLTDPERPPATFDDTDPERPAFGPGTLDVIPIIGGAADLDPVIPSTRPHQPIATALPISSESPRSHAPAPAFTSSAASRAAASPRSFADTHYKLPAIDLGAAEQRRTNWARRVGASAVALGIIASIILGTRNEILVPLITGQLGYHIIHRFWTPLLTYGALTMLMLALALAGVAFGLSRRNRSRGQPASHRRASSGRVEQSDGS